VKMDIIHHYHRIYNYYLSLGYKQSIKVLEFAKSSTLTMSTEQSSVVDGSKALITKTSIMLGLGNMNQWW